jgi:hypothetical protein
VFQASGRRRRGGGTVGGKATKAAVFIEHFATKSNATADRRAQLSLSLSLSF